MSRKGKPLKKRAAWRLLSDEVILESASKYQTKMQWQAADKLSWYAAMARGRAFYQRCTSRMPKAAWPKHKPKDQYAWWRFLPEEWLTASARQFKTRSEWKRGDYELYGAAKARGDATFARCTAHMVTGSNPYNTPYIVYLFDFADGYWYVGLTFKERQRHASHLQGGPVCAHIKVCPTFKYQLLETGIVGPAAAGLAEIRWEEHFKATGRPKLNVRKCGSTGGTGSLFRCNETDVKADASKYTTREAWKLASGQMFRASVRMGIYAEATAHMPKRARVVPSVETKMKIASSAKGKKKSVEHRAAMSKAKLAAWSDPLFRERGIAQLAEARQHRISASTPPAPAPVSLQTPHTSSSETAFS